MSNAPKFRKKAVEFEQLKQFDRAIASYVRAIEENENAGEEVDVALFNKVGDLTLRGGRVTEAVTYYERAVEHYVTSGLYDNAIALCNKILRNAPGRSNVYFTLGRICGRKGLRSDATRNFLEYATRMQREGKVDEGMRALAEVADLMPEPTEVGRLVEEHAARAGISLRRRTTPTRNALQSAAEGGKSMFGMSKDLVFLDIDYDAPRVSAAGARTPPIQRATEPEIVGEQSHNSISTDDIFADIAEPEFLTPANAAAQSVHEDALFTDEAERDDAPGIDQHDETSVTAATPALEDLMIFDPGVESENSKSSDNASTVVDGASILKPFVDPSTPLPVLPGLEPTAIAGSPSFLQTIASSEIIENFLHRGVARGQSRGTGTPVVVRPMPTLPHLPLIASEARVGEPHVGAAHDTKAAAAVIAVVNTQEQDAGVSVSNVVAVPVGIATAVDVADTAISQRHTAGDIVNYAVAQELLATVSIDPLDGYTSDEEGQNAAPVDDVTIDSLNVTTNRVVVPDNAELLADLDIAAVIELSAAMVDPVHDLEIEEFEPSNNELAHSRFGRVESDASPASDSFNAADELPPLIFPMPTDVDADVANHIGCALDQALESADEANFDAAFDATFDATYEAAYDATYDATFDETYDSTYDSSAGPNIELPFLIPAELDHVVFIDDVAAQKNAEVVTASRDLDDLFEDTIVPTATAAAEATIAATSRRDDMQDAVGSEPTNWTLRRRLAEALFEAGERDGAIAELNIALSGFERDAQLTDAAEIADELVRVAGEEVSHHQKRVELAIRMGDQNRLREAYLDLADTFVRRSEDLRAKAVYARVLEIDPWDDRARTALGDAAPPPPLRAADAADSEDVILADWLRDDDEPASTRLRMREPEMSGNEQNDFDSLLRHFKEGVARALGEDDYDSHYDLGVAYKEMGLLDDAIGEFQKALRSRTYRLAAYEALGQCFLEQQSYKVAVTVLSRALHEPAFQEEQRVGVLYLLGFSCEVLQRFDEARSYFQRVYATDIHFRDVGQRLADLERITR